MFITSSLCSGIQGLAHIVRTETSRKLNFWNHNRHTAAIDKPTLARIVAFGAKHGAISVTVVSGMLTRTRWTRWLNLISQIVSFNKMLRNTRQT